MSTTLDYNTWTKVNNTFVRENQSYDRKSNYDKTENDCILSCQNDPNCGAVYYYASSDQKYKECSLINPLQIDNLYANKDTVLNDLTGTLRNAYVKKWFVPNTQQTQIKESSGKLSIFLVIVIVLIIIFFIYKKFIK